MKEDFVVEEYQWAQFNTASVSICLSGGFEKDQTNSTVVFLSVANIETAFAILKSRGARIVSELFVGDDGTKAFDLEDLDRNMFKIIQLAR